MKEKKTERVPVTRYREYWICGIDECGGRMQKTIQWILAAEPDQPMRQIYECEICGRQEDSAEEWPRVVEEDSVAHGARRDRAPECVRREKSRAESQRSGDIAPLPLRISRLCFGENTLKPLDSIESTPLISIDERYGDVESVTISGCEYVKDGNGYLRPKSWLDRES